jgi:hypothetical protein
LILLFTQHVIARNKVANSVGYEYVKEHFADRRSWYVVSTEEVRSVSDVSCVHRIRYAQFVVYSMRGERLCFQYYHDWRDADSGNGFDLGRYMGLYFEKEGIFDTKVNGYSASTMLKAKCALLGLNATASEDVEKASNVSDQVIVTFLVTIGVFSADWQYAISKPLQDISGFFLTRTRCSYRPDPVWTYELNEPLAMALDMIAGSRNTLRETKGAFMVPRAEVPPFSRAGLSDNISYAELLKFVTPLPTELTEEEGPTFWGRSVLRDELDSDEIPRTTSYPRLPLFVKDWERGRDTPFDMTVPVVRAQLVLHSHLEDWFAFAAETSDEEEDVQIEPGQFPSPPMKLRNNAGLERMKNFLQESEIVVSDAGRELERDRGHSTRTTRTEFILRPKAGSQLHYAPTTIVFKFCVCQSNWGENLEPDAIKLSVFEDSNYDVFSYSRKISNKTAAEPTSTAPLKKEAFIGESTYKTEKDHGLKRRLTFSSSRGPSPSLPFADVETAPFQGSTLRNLSRGSFWRSDIHWNVVRLLATRRHPDLSLPRSQQRPPWFCGKNISFRNERSNRCTC